MHSLPTRLKHQLPHGTSLKVRPNTVYIVGGSVRDLLLGRSPIDYDLAVAVNPEGFAQRLASRTKGRLVILGKPGLKLYRVVTPSYVFDVSKMAGPSIQNDLMRRDFTINAMAADAANGEIIDAFNGRKDLIAGRVHMVSEAAFRQDPVRLIRAFRMAASLDFRLSTQTAQAIQTQVSLIANSAGERVWSELLKILEARRSVRFIRQMAACGLLETILPEITVSCCQPPSYQPSDTFNHILDAFSELETHLLDSSAMIAPAMAAGTLSKTLIPKGLLKFALFLKDFAGSPLANQVDEGSSQNGPAAHLRRRFKMSNKQANYIDFIIQHYQMPLSLFNAFQKRQLPDTAVTRLFMSSGDKLPDLLLYAKAIITADSNNRYDRSKKFSIFAQDLLNRFYSVFLPRSNAPPLITGKDLISYFNMSPSPAFRFLLDRVETDRLTGRIQTKGEALDLVDHLLQDRLIKI